jgi:glutamyl-tRNA synthetase
LEGLEWIGIDWDEGPYFQSQRFDVYKKYARSFLIQGSVLLHVLREQLEKICEKSNGGGGKPKYDGTADGKELSKTMTR